MTNDWRRAFDIYVTGRNRALTTDEKRRSAGAGKSASVGPATTGATTTGISKFGVPIPQTLEYYRNAGSWRDRIEAFRKREAGPGA